MSSTIVTALLVVALIAQSICFDLRAKRYQGDWHSKSAHDPQIGTNQRPALGGPILSDQDTSGQHGSATRERRQMDFPERNPPAGGAQFPDTAPGPVSHGTDGFSGQQSSNPGIGGEQPRQRRQHYPERNPQAGVAQFPDSAPGPINQPGVPAAGSDRFGSSNPGIGGQQQRSKRDQVGPPPQTPGQGIYVQTGVNPPTDSQGPSIYSQAGTYDNTNSQGNNPRAKREQADMPPQTHLGEMGVNPPANNQDPIERGSYSINEGNNRGSNPSRSRRQQPDWGMQPAQNQVPPQPGYQSPGLGGMQGTQGFGFSGGGAGSQQPQGQQPGQGAYGQYGMNQGYPQGQFQGMSGDGNQGLSGQQPFRP